MSLFKNAVLLLVDVQSGFDDPYWGLRQRGITTIIIVGLTTNHCISTTARMAGNLGFQTYVVSDATATFDRLALDGSVRVAADVHAAALSDLNDEFATIVDTESVLRDKQP